MCDSIVALRHFRDEMKNLSTTVVSLNIKKNRVAFLGKSHDIKNHFYDLRLYHRQEENKIPITNMLCNLHGILEYVFLRMSDNSYVILGIWITPLVSASRRLWFLRSHYCFLNPVGTHAPLARIPAPLHAFQQFWFHRRRFLSRFISCQPAMGILKLTAAPLAWAWTRSCRQINISSRFCLHPTASFGNRASRGAEARSEVRERKREREGEMRWLSQFYLGCEVGTLKNALW